MALWCKSRFPTSWRASASQCWNLLSARSGISTSPRLPQAREPAQSWREFGARESSTAWGAFEGPFLDRLRERLEPLGRIEVQIAASNDGDYFRLHMDGGPPDTREISFVYFLHGEPRRFTGGELCVAGETVLPEGDTLVFFPSVSPHEVLPLSVPSRTFADSRFTVNGWIHRKRM
jgi:hypothetical protein